MTLLEIPARRRSEQQKDDRLRDITTELDGIAGALRARAVRPHAR